LAWSTEIFISNFPQLALG